MKPEATFTNGRITLLHMDCMEYMATLPDKAFDLAIVDPPYGIGMDGGAIGKNRFDKKDWDAQIPTMEYFHELSRVSLNCIIWGGNYFAQHLHPSGAWIYWDKMQDGFGKTFASGELAYSNLSMPMRQFRYANQGNYVGLPGAITLKTKTMRDLKIHPTQKPIALYEWLLTNYAKPGQRILDTHLGSGSSAIAAHYFGCEFVGMELDADYYKAAVERFKRETAQVAMDL